VAAIAERPVKNFPTFAAFFCGLTVIDKGSNSREIAVLDYEGDL